MSTSPTDRAGTSSGHRLTGLAMRGTMAAALLAAAFLFVLAGQASAETTHKFLYSFPSSGAPQVGGVDAQGFVYVYDTSANVVSKYDGEGNPVNFSALGTNEIDGMGGFDCPTTPSDCDRVPTNGFNGTYGNTGGNLAVDPRSSGTGAGYIYVANTTNNNVGHPPPGKVEVFAPTGQYLGQLDNTITFPDRCVGGCQMRNVSVAANGHVFVAYCCGAEFDQFAPTNPVPQNFEFIGQIRQEGLCGWSYGVGGTPYSYGLCGNTWFKYTQAAWLKPRGVSDWIDFSPDPGPFGDGGDFPEGNDFFDRLSIDPANGDVYLTGASSNVEKWSVDNERIGQRFSGPGFTLVTRIGFDHSGGPNDGHLYMRTSENGGSSVGVFSPPVTIPDITYGEFELGHDSVDVNATIGLDGGPQVDQCVVEWGQGFDNNENPLYQDSAPCDQATPYASETDVTASITGLNTEQSYNVRILATNENGTTMGANRAVRPPAVLSLQTGDATDIDRTSASLNGTLDPDGIPTTYWFEYGLDTDYDTVTPTQPAGSGSGVIQLAPVQLTQLQSGKTYHYRLVAENSLGRTYGEGRTFQAAREPAIAGLRATDITETSAVIHARINPSGYDSEYRFEYGTTPTYGQTVPVPDGSVGSGEEFVPVSADLTGLQPGVTYHFRVVASNQWGTSISDNTTFNFFPPTCPNEHVRQQTGSNYLPDCRAYELVSPGEAGAVQLFPGGITQELGAGFGLGEVFEFSITPQNSGRATGPSRLAFFGGLGSVGGANTPNSLIDLYVSTRTSDGWETTYPGLSGDEALGAARPKCSATLDTCLMHKAPDLLGTDPETLMGENAPYLFDVSGESRGRLPTNLALVPGGQHFVGDQRASADFSTYAFSSRDLAFAPGGKTTAPGSAYANDIDAKTVRIISKLPNGDDLPLASGDGEDVIKIRGISDDGTRILMSTASLDGPMRLYMRVNETVTYDVSRGTGVKFIDMTADGSVVYFISNISLAAEDTDSGADLYRWDEDGDTLTLVSKGNGQGNSDDCNASFVPECAADVLAPDRGISQFEEPGIDDYIASQSGDIYFYSPEQLDPANPGVRNQRNLYLYREGEVRYVATLDPGTEINRSQISPDGTRAAFITASQLTGYDNDGRRQMYAYDADTGVIRCASCNPTGEPPAHDVIGSQGGRFMSDDGRAFFTTRDGLVPQDTNNLADVYEFVDGAPQLISSGRANQDLYGGGAFFPPQVVGLEAVSGDGVDVYFSTFDTLVKEDLNGEFVKFYDARTGGGFPEPSELQPCAAADECHAGGSSRPDPRAIGTKANLGSHGTRPPAARRCDDQTKRAQRAARSAKRIRQRAKRASGARRAQMLRRARRAAKTAKRQSQAAKQCRVRIRRAS